MLKKADIYDIINQFNCIIYERRRTVLELLGWMLRVLDTRMTTPKMYGPFHLAFFALSIAFGIFLYRIKKKPDERFVRKLLLVTSVIVVLFEVIKQINYTFSYDGATITADYQWYAFPYQFCSTPMYVGLLCAFVKGRMHDAMCSYLATFSVFAGFVVMLYPPQVYIDVIAINVQTMVCHGLMISIGIYLLASGYVKLQHRTILGAIAVFGVLVGIAVAANELVYYSGIVGDETFNMFYISRHYPPSLPVYSSVQAVVAYPWCMIIYILVFSLAAYVVLLLSMLIRRVYIRLSSPERKRELVLNK